MTDTSVANTRRRRSARVILLDSRKHVLLIRFCVSRSDGPFMFWATPGGSVEDGEADRDAAGRELIEELGLNLPLEGPVHTVTGEFEHMGERVTNTDVFFLGRCHRDAPRLEPRDTQERLAIHEIRWWGVSEIEAATETIFPADLAKVVRQQT